MVFLRSASQWGRSLCFCCGLSRSARWFSFTCWDSTCRLVWERWALTSWGHCWISPGEVPQSRSENWTLKWSVHIRAACILLRLTRNQLVFFFLLGKNSRMHQTWVGMFEMFFDALHLLTDLGSASTSPLIVTRWIACLLTSCSLCSLEPDAWSRPRTNQLNVGVEILIFVDSLCSFLSPVYK